MRSIWHGRDREKPGTKSFSATPTPRYLQDLVPFLDALAVGRAPLLHTRHEDAHVVPTSQPQPHAPGLHKLHHSGVRTVPARGRPGGNTMMVTNAEPPALEQPQGSALPTTSCSDAPIVGGSSGSGSAVGAVVAILFHGFQCVCKEGELVQEVPMAVCLFPRPPRHGESWWDGSGDTEKPGACSEPSAPPSTI